MLDPSEKVGDVSYSVVPRVVDGIEGLFCAVETPFHAELLVFGLALGDRRSASLTLYSVIWTRHLERKSRFVRVSLAPDLFTNPHP